MKGNASSWRLTDAEVEEIAMCLRHRYDDLVSGGASEFEITELKSLTERFESSLKNAKRRLNVNGKER